MSLQRHAYGKDQGQGHGHAAGDPAPIGKTTLVAQLQNQAAPGARDPTGAVSKPRPVAVGLQGMTDLVLALRAMSNGVGKGYMTFAALQIVDQGDHQIGLATGDHTKSGAAHAEQVAYQRLRGNPQVKEAIADRSIVGGKLIAVVDQFPCPEDQANCQALLTGYAAELGVELKVHVISAPNPKQPGTAMAPKQGIKQPDPVPYEIPELGAKAPASSALAGVSANLTTVAEIMPKVTKALHHGQAALLVIDAVVAIANILSSKGGSQGMSEKNAVAAADTLSTDMRAVASSYVKIHQQLQALALKLGPLIYAGSDPAALLEADRECLALRTQLQGLRADLAAVAVPIARQLKEVTAKHKALEAILTSPVMGAALSVSGSDMQQIVMFEAWNDMQQVMGRLETAKAAIDTTLSTLGKDIDFLGAADVQLTSAAASAGKP